MKRKTMFLAAIAGLILALSAGYRWRRMPDQVDVTVTARISAYEELMQSFMQVDDSLMLYREVAPLATPGLQALAAIAVDRAGRIYAGGGRRMVVLSPGGAPVRRLEVAADITCLAVEDENGLFIGLGNAVKRYNADGALTAEFSGISRDALITSLAVAGEYVFAADARGRVVLCFDHDGRPVRTIDGRQADDRTGFLVPSPCFDLARGLGRTLWVVNPGRHRLEEYNFEGERIHAWPERAGMELEAFCGCCNPAHIARLSDGAIVTSEKGMARVKLYSRRGEFAGVVAAPAQFDSQTMSLDLAVDKNDRVLVADPARMQVRVFERIGD